MYDVTKADHAVNFINCLKHTKGKWRGVNDRGFVYVSE